MMVRTWVAVLAAAAVVGGASAADLSTLDGQAPLVIGHRGLPGLVPEETAAGYELAAHLGADSFELDMHMTKDCVLVARHNPWLADNTDITEVATTNQAVAARKRTAPGVMVPVTWPKTPQSGPAEYLTDSRPPATVKTALIVDGDDHTNDWAISDFTVAELKQWIGGTTYDARADRPTHLNGLLPVLTVQEVIDLAKAKSVQLGRTITVYPETKNPTWNNAQAIANGCGTAGSRPFEDAVITLMEQNGYTAKTAPVLVQSFEPSSLKYMVAHGLRTRVVQLIDGDGVDLRTGMVTFDDFATGRPYDWSLAGDARHYDAMVTPAGLAEIKTYADGIGPWKPYVIPWKVAPWPEAKADGTPAKPGTPDAAAMAPTGLVADAHKAGLFVHVFTFRNEKRYLPGSYGNDPVQEYLAFYRAGVDGVFSDFTHTAVAARGIFLKEAGK